MQEEQISQQLGEIKELLAGQSQTLKGQGEILKSHDGLFGSIDEKITRIESVLNKVVLKLVEHDARFDELVTKKEFAEYRHYQAGVNDELIAKTTRLDEERLATIEWLRGVEEKIEGHDELIQENAVDIHQLKEILAV